MTSHRGRNDGGARKKKILENDLSICFVFYD